MDLNSMLNARPDSADSALDTKSVKQRSPGGSSASPAESRVAQETKLIPASDSEELRRLDPQRPNTELLSPKSKRKYEELDATPGNKRERRSTGTCSEHGSATPVHPTAPAAAVANARFISLDDGVRPVNDLVSTITRALTYYIAADERLAGKEGLEIEAKLGRVVDRQSGARLHEAHFPVTSAVLLNQSFREMRFESNMTAEQHAKFNRYLNQHVERGNPKHERHDPSRPKLTYQHTHTTSKLFASQSRYEHAPNAKIRVTTNDRDGKVVESIAKESLEHLHILCPNHPFDIRISLNLEHAMTGPAGDLLNTRKKDRVSYKLPTHQVDLTKVTNAGGGDLRYEMEVELIGMAALQKHAQKAQEDWNLELTKREHGLAMDIGTNEFEWIIAGFLGTIMRLNDVARPR